MSSAAIAAAAFAVALVATPLAMAAARRTGIMDHPGALKSQAVAVPYLGGAAVLAGVAVGAAASRPIVLLPLAGATGLGVADDRFDLPSWARVAGQVGIGAAVVAIFPVQLPGVAAALIFVAITALLINGVNLLDGLDMLAGGVAAVAALGFAIALEGSGRQLAVALVGALAGFLCYNRRPARVYLGDGGSYLLGTSLAVLLAESWGPGIAYPRGTAALALVALPVAEVVFAVVRRLRGRRSLVAGDRGHPYDRLVERGWPRPAASLAYVAVGALLTAAALAAGPDRSVVPAVVVDVAAASVLLVAARVTGGLAPDPVTRS